MNKRDDFLPTWSVVLIDAFFCFCSLALAYLLRFNFDIPADKSEPFIYLFPFLIISRCLGFYVAGIYKNPVRYTDSKGKVRIAMIQFVVTMFLGFSHFVFAVCSFTHFIIPYSIIVIEYFLSTSIFIAVMDNQQWFYNLYHGIEKILIKGVGVLKKSDSKMDTLIILFLVITVAPLIFVSFYNHPSADDFCYAEMLHDKGGFFAAQKAWYLTWTGRYFAMFLSSLNPLVFHSVIGYKLNSVIIVISFVLALYWLFGIIFTEMSRFSKWCITSLTVLLYFLYLPDIAEGLFWISGADTAQVPVVLTFLLLGCIIKFLKSGQKKYFVYSVILSAAIIGSYEVLMACTDALILVITMANYRHTRKINYYMLALLGVAILLSIFSITAPGNKLREAHFPHQHQFLFSIQHAWFWGGLFQSSWIFQNIYLFLLVFFWVFAKTDSGKLNKPWINPILVLLFSIFLPFVFTFIGFWSMGEVLPLRTMNVAYFYFLLGSVYFLYSLTWYLKQQLNFKSIQIPGMYSGLLVLMVYFALNTPNYLVFYNDKSEVRRPNNVNLVYDDIFSGRIAYFNKQVIQRNEAVKNSKENPCKLQPITYIPEVFVYKDITADTTFWITELFSEYYGKPCVLSK